MSGGLMRHFRGVGFILLLSPGVLAEVPPVAVRVPQPKAWTGQRLSLQVELRAPGSFTGTARFDLPKLPGTLLMKIGNPVISSESIDGRSMFVQTHEFALFSQKSGQLEVPSFPVYFTHQEGFTGPSVEVETKTPPVIVEIQRPPGSDGIGFLITTESLEVIDSWDSIPDRPQIGEIFKRTITQRASNITGMALAPVPASAPEGIRLYPGEAATHDQLERGDFIGERVETMTYLLQQPGTHILPSLTYVWWNPKTKTLESHSLPAVTFQVSAPPSPKAAAPVPNHLAWPWLLVPALVIPWGIWQRRHLVGWVKRYWKKWKSPNRLAARRLLRACLHNDFQSAAVAWNEWRVTQPAEFQPSTELRIAVLALQRQLFGASSSNEWQGDELARAFGDTWTAARNPVSHQVTSLLPELNPPTLPQ